MSDEFLQMFVQTNGSNDPLRMREMLSLVEELRNSCNGWQKCIVSLMNGDIKEDKMRFLCLQTVEHYMKNYYAKASTSEQTTIRQFLLRWIQMFCVNSVVTTANFVKNKAAQIFSLAFTHDYPERWPAYFDDLINTLSLGPNAAEHFLRVLKAINSEIADRCLSYTALETSRNKNIKTEMREKNVQQIVTALYDILKIYEVSHSEITSMCLETLGMYVHWIDVGLIVNPDFMDTLARLLPVPCLSESVLVCIDSIARKKMEHLEKCKLVEFLMSMLRDVGVLGVLSQFESKFVTKLSQLVNSMGVALLDSYGKLRKTGGDIEQLQFFELVIEDKIPILLQFLAHDSDSVSKSVLEFAKSYVHYLKTRDRATEQQTEKLRMLMVTVIHKMRSAEPYDFDSTGQDYEDFQEYRRGLKIILEGILSLNKELVINYILELANQNLKEWRNSTFSDVEVILAALVFVGESSPLHTGLLPEKNGTLDTLINVVVDSGVFSFPHSSVQVLFFEIMLRFENTLMSEPQKILIIINIFLGDYGLRHPEQKLRSRLACLFCKFIKGSITVLQNSAKQVLDALEVIFVAGCFPCYDDRAEWLSLEDQLYIFEAISFLIVSSSVPAQDKIVALQRLILPNITTFNNFYQDFLKETNATNRERLSDRLGHCISVATRLSKGFTQKIDMESVGCVCIFTQCLDVFLNVLSVTNQSNFLRNSLRQFLKRMIASLTTDILPYVLQASIRLLQENDPQNVQDCLQYLVQVIHKFRNDALPIFRDIFPKIMNSVFGCLGAPIDDKDFDMKKERDYLKKLYFQFISAVIMSVPDAFYIQDYSIKKEILISVAQTALESPDPVAQKESFLILKNLIASSSGRDAGDATIHFIYQTIIDVCFQALKKKKDSNSYNATMMVLQECAVCLKAIHIKVGEEMTRYVETTYLSNPSVPPQYKEQFTRAINADIKTLLIFLRVFCGINDSNT